VAERDRRHWAAYNDGQVGRAMRSLCADVIEMAGPGAGRVAIDLGCGAGIETAALLAAGWEVHAFDSAPGTRERVGAQVLRTMRNTNERSAAAAPPDLQAAGPGSERAGTGDEGQSFVADLARGGADAAGLVGERDGGGGQGEPLAGELVAAGVGDGSSAAGPAREPVAGGEGGEPLAVGGGGEALTAGGPLAVIEADLAALERLPAAALVYSGYSLQYLAPGDFARVWGLVRECLQPGGWLAVNLLGDRDEWAGTPGETFLSEDAVRALVAGLEVVRFDEEDGEGPSFGGRKHWHVFDVIARRPPR